MAKYHINKRGEADTCDAKEICPLGGLEEHYSTKAEAQAAFEKANSSLPPAITKNPWTSEKLDKLGTAQEEMLAHHIATGTHLTDEDYEARREYIRQVNKTYPSTHKHYSKRIQGKVKYPPEREKFHDEIVEEIANSYSSVKKEGRVLMTGGMPGSGKTTLLKKVLGDKISSYASLNPDDVKVLMAKKGMTPKIKGLTLLETDELIRYEAQIIYEKLYERVTKEKTNIIIDKTMVRAEPVLKSIEGLKSSGYSEIKAVFADIDPDDAYDRILARHREGINEYIDSGGKTLGERVVPGAAIVASRVENSPYKSKNAEVLVELEKAGVFSEEPRVFDTSTFATEEIFVTGLLKT